jgi:hypothetical protein
MTRRAPLSKADRRAMVDALRAMRRSGARNLSLAHASGLSRPAVSTLISRGTK